MKHSASGSMTESHEPKVAIPCEGSGESVLQKLYIDLCNLIVESRTPGLNDRGYGDGVHCPPLLGSNKHICDLSTPECQKHQTIIHNLLQAAPSNSFEIEVLLLPECCTESKLKERIQNNEYNLVERWSINFTFGNVESNVEVSQLLRAVRSFLHFSQLSAWLSSTSGKSPANICYWVNPKLESLCTNFKHEPEVHSFPFCKIDEDLAGCVKVEFPSRTQYIPIIPCSKHPPLCRYSLRAINEDSDLCKSIPLNQEIVRQLHKTCSTEQSKITTVNYVPEPSSLMLDPGSLLKTLSTAMPDVSKVNRVLKHSNSQDSLLNSSNVPLDLKGKTDIIPKKPPTYVCNYAETISLGLSQENLCYDKRRLARQLRKTELKMKKFKKGSFSPLVSKTLVPILSSDVYNLNQNTINLSVKSSKGSNVSNLLYNMSSSENSLLKCIESSPVNLEKYPFPSSQNICRLLSKKSKTVKRKDCDINTETISVLPHKKKCCDINLSSQIHKYHSTLSSTIVWPQSSNASQVKDIINKKLQVVDKVLQENCSCSSLTPYCYCNNIQMLKEKQNYSNESFSIQSTAILSGTHTCDTNISCSFVQDDILKKSKPNVSWLNSDLKLSKRTCISQIDNFETNITKKPRLLNECKQLSNLFTDTSCTVSKSQLNKTKQRKYLVTSYTDQKYSPKKYSSSGCFKKSCSSYTSSHTLYNFNSVKKNCASNNYSNSSDELPNQNLLHKIECCMEKNKQEKKMTLNCSKISSGLQSEKERFNKLHFISDQTNNEEIMEQDRSKLLDDDVIDSNISNQTSESAKADFETSNKLELPKEKYKLLLKATKNILSRKNSILKSCKEGITENMLHQTTLNSFKVRKCYNYNSRKEENIYKSPTYLQNNVEPYTSQALKKCVPFVSPTYRQNEALPNVPWASVTEASTELEKNKIYTEKINSCKNDNKSNHKFNSSLNLQIMSLQNDHQSTLILNSPVPTASRNLFQITDENLECFPNRTSKFPKAKKLIVNFEESILKGCLPMLKNVKGFHAEIGASGSFCPNHLTLPADVSFYELGNPHQGTAPYVAHVTMGNSEYYLPKKGAVQVTLFNPSETVVKMFVLNYDLSSMPPLCHTFIRQKTYYLPVGLHKEYPTSQKWLRFIIHLRFASSKTGRIFLHEDFKIVVLNKSNDDAASEFKQEPRELCSFLSVPMNPTFSNI